MPYWARVSARFGGVLWGLRYRVWELEAVDMGFRYPGMGIGDCGYGKKVSPYGKTCRNALRSPVMGASSGNGLWAEKPCIDGLGADFLPYWVAGYGNCRR
jgi:hypothetical protein